MYKDQTCKILYASENYDMDYDPVSSLNVNNYRHTATRGASTSLNSETLPTGQVFDLSVVMIRSRPAARESPY